MLDPSALRTTSAQSSYAVECVTAKELGRHPDAFDVWQRLLQQNRYPGAFYSSPPWIEHVTEKCPRVLSFIARRANGSIAGVVPVAEHSYALGRESGIPPLASTTISVADVLGSVPFLPPDEHLFRDWLDRVFSAFPDCDAIFFDALPIASPCFDVLRSSARHFLYHSSGVRRAHWIDLGTSFEGYLERIGDGTRYHLQRAVRQFRSRTRNGLQLVCARSPGDVERFLSEAGYVRRRSWQYEHTAGRLRDLSNAGKDFCDLAGRGVLRSYVLRANEEPCAFVIGYQYDGTYYYADAGYDRAFARHSPGKALFHLLLEHLFEHDRPEVLHFGKGDDRYKQRLATAGCEETSVLLFRPGLANLVRKQGLGLISALGKLLSI